MRICRHRECSQGMEALRSLCWVTDLKCTVLHCTVLHYTALHYTALHCTALHCTIQHSTLFYPTTLNCSALIHPHMLTTPQVQEMLRICAEHLTDDAEHQSVAVLGIALVVLGEDVGTEVSHFICHLIHSSKLFLT